MYPAIRPENITTTPNKNTFINMKMWLHEIFVS